MPHFAEFAQIVPISDSSATNHDAPQVGHIFEAS